MLNPGIRIYQCRLEKGWTQAGLARRAGIAQANLSNIEKGKKDFTVSTLMRLAQALDVPASDLMEAKSSPPKLPLTRNRLEILARAVADPALKSPAEIRQLAGFFRQALLPSDPPLASQKIEQAWHELRRRFTSREIQTVKQRIEDERQRIYAKKTN